MVERQAAAVAESYVLLRDTLLVSGRDRKTWLDGLVTCAVSAVDQQRAGYGLLLNKQGKIVTDLWLLDDGLRLFIGVAPGHGAATRELLDRYLVMEDAELLEPEQPLVWRVVTGAGTLGALEPLAGACSALGALELSGLSALAVVLPATRQEALATYGLAPARGERELGRLLARHGIGVFGVDFSERDNPHEAALDRVAISWTKGCYLGQEVVCMQDMRGKVKRRLVLLEALEPAQAIPELLGADVVAPGSGSPAGKVTSVHEAPEGAPRLFLASISTPALEAKAELSVLGRPVRVVETAPRRVE